MRIYGNKENPVSANKAVTQDQQSGLKKKSILPEDKVTISAVKKESKILNEIFAQYYDYTLRVNAAKQFNGNNTQPIDKQEQASIPSINLQDNKLVEEVKSKIRNDKGQSMLYIARSTLEKPFKVNLTGIIAQANTATGVPNVDIKEAMEMLSKSLSCLIEKMK